MIKFIALYLRISIEDNDNKDESNSITSQRLLLKEFLQGKPELSNCVVREYCDDGYSGTNFDRPGVTELIEHVKQNLISCIIVKDFSRFSRDFIEMGAYLDQIFPFMGVRFISVNDNFDSNKNRGMTVEMDTAFKTLLNDFYCKDISIKVKTAIQNKCRNGEFAYGQAPFGYEKDPDQKNKLRINEKEAEIIRNIFELSAGGMTAVAIEKKLNEEKVPTCRQMRGKAKEDSGRVCCWNSNYLRCILNNRFYLGEFIYHKTEPESVGSKKKKRLPKSEWITQPGNHEPLVSEELFIKAGYSKGNNSTKRIRPKHPLTGKLHCGGCGYAMVYKKPYKEGVIPRFECSKHSQLKIDTCCTYFRAEILEELILTMITKELLKLADMQENREAVKMYLRNRMVILEGKILSTKKKKEELEKGLFIIYEDYTKEKISVVEYKKAKECIERGINKCDTSICQYQEDLSVTEGVYFDNNKDLRQIIKYSKIDMLTQDVVDSFVNKIIVYKNKSIEIEWAFLMGSHEE